MVNFLEPLFGSYQFGGWALERSIKAAKTLNERAARIRQVAEPLALMTIEDAKQSASTLSFPQSSSNASKHLACSF